MTAQTKAHELLDALNDKYMENCLIDRSAPVNHTDLYLINLCEYQQTQIEELAARLFMLEKCVVNLQHLVLQLQGVL